MRETIEWVPVAECGRCYVRCSAPRQPESAQPARTLAQPADGQASLDQGLPRRKPGARRGDARLSSAAAWLTC